MYNLKQRYPILQNCTYLNTAANGLMSQQLLDYRTSLLETYRDQASLFTDQRDFIFNQVRTRVASFIDAAPSETALVPNFSTAFLNLLQLLPRSGRFLLLQDDYPSINWAVQSYGFECHYVVIDTALEDRILDACHKHQPDYLALSLVQYISGIRIDLDFLKELKLQFPRLVIIADATQFVGIEEFRFRESGIDILAASCYKWLNAGQGNGFITFKESVVPRIKPDFVTWSPDREFSNARGSFMGLFEPGHLDIISFQGLRHAIDFVNDYGIEAIQRNINTLAGAAHQAFTDRDLLDRSVVKRAAASPIFNIEGDHKLFEKLKQENIICSLRGPGIRVSFSYYNTTIDLHRLLDIIDS